MTDQQPNVVSEDPNAGLATPVMDLAAAAVVGAIALWMAIESLRLPSPADIITAPGLLPFLTAGSLLIMAVLLAANALQRRRTVAPGADRLELPADFRRSMLLGLIVIVYVAALQYLPIKSDLRIGGLRVVIGNFEVATVIVLTTVLRIFWSRTLWHCLAISLGWTAFLSLVFRVIFVIHLP